MKNKKKFLISSLIFVASITTFSFNFYYTIASVITMVSVSFILLLIANKSFGGISGDTIGATNEISRFFIYLIYSTF